MNQFKKTTQKREKRKGIYFQLGLIIAGGLTLVAFEWTSPIVISELPGVIIDSREEWDMPIILPEPEIEKPKVKYTKAPKKSQLFKVVEKLIEPIPEPNPEPEIKFDPNEFKVVEKFVEDKVRLGAEIMPEFLGGFEGLYKFLGENIKYPKMERIAGIQGTVYLEFVVDRKGEIKNIKVKKGVNEAIDAEAIRVLKAMPNWKPGKQAGKTVSVRFTLPISFKLKG
jgi:protein TonB